MVEPKGREIEHIAGSQICHNEASLLSPGQFGGLHTGCKIWQRERRKVLRYIRRGLGMAGVEKGIDAERSPRPRWEEQKPLPPLELRLQCSNAGLGDRSESGGA